MKAAVRRRYGSPEQIEIVDEEKPAPADDEVLVRVHAASVNPADWYALTGWVVLLRLPTGQFKPKSHRLGTDFAGVVEAVGSEVTHVSPGDRVYGGRTGALAEHIVVKNAVVAIPASVTFEQAAAMPTAAITALQGLRDKGEVAPGHRVLINGASGGVGTFAIQIAKALGAHATAVCSTGKMELARTLGADEVVDYRTEDFTRSGERYDLVLDIAGNRSWRALSRVLTRRGRVVIVGAPRGGRLVGPLRRIIGKRLAGMLSRRSAVFFIAKFNRPDLETLAEMAAAGQVTPVIDATYPLAETARAFRHLGDGHAAGKVVVTL